MPMPPQTTTISSCSKKSKLRPSCSPLRRVQFFVRPLTSRSSAATIATLGIAVGSEPFHSAAQSPVRGYRLPSQLTLCLARTGPHLFLSHAHRLDSRARLAAEQPS